MHLGSLYTALASFLDARSRQGRWLLRIDDIDTPRNVEGAGEAILRCLEAFGLHWDGKVYYQSRHLADYQDVLNQLQPQLFACRCSRKKLANQPIYPGFCRDLGLALEKNCALRLQAPYTNIGFNDALQGRFEQNLAREVGDYVIKRRDGLFAYQLAVVVDDHIQGITHIVRGADLLDSTPRQIYTQNLLGYATPHYMHLPLIVDDEGNKLSKQTLAAPVEAAQPAETLFAVLALLRQQPPADLQRAPLAELLQWAIAHWQPERLKKTRAIQAPIH